MILHVDMDAFFASVEQRDNPSLRGKPVVVGGLSKRSVVSTASYEARKFDIHSAMPMFMAFEKCPDLIVIPVNKQKYSLVSKKIMEIFHQFSPVVEPVSIDEAYIDVTGCERILGSHKEIAWSIKQKIKKELELTCSLGAAPLRFLAKIASDMNKPDGITIIEKNQAKEFALAVDIQRIPGVGKVAMKQMNLLGIRKLGDINNFSHNILLNKFGKFGNKLFEFVNCLDNSSIGKKEKRKSISSESTLDKDTAEMETIKKHILAHSGIVGKELRKQKLFAANIFIKLKFNDFSQITKQKQLKIPVSSSMDIFNHALLLAKNSKISKKVRLIGVGASSLSGKKIPIQIDMFEPVEEKSNKWEKIDKTIDAISDKFGNNIVNKAIFY